MGVNMKIMVVWDMTPRISLDSTRILLPPLSKYETSTLKIVVAGTSYDMA